MTGSARKSHRRQVAVMAPWPSVCLGGPSCTWVLGCMESRKTLVIIVFWLFAMKKWLSAWSACAETHLQCFLLYWLVMGQKLAALTGSRCWQEAQHPHVTKSSMLLSLKVEVWECLHMQPPSLLEQGRINATATATSLRKVFYLQWGWYRSRSKNERLSSHLHSTFTSCCNPNCRLDGYHNDGASKPGFRSQLSPVLSQYWALGSTTSEPQPSLFVQGWPEDAK